MSKNVYTLGTGGVCGDDSSKFCGDMMDFLLDDDDTGDVLPDDDTLDALLDEDDDVDDSDMIIVIGE